VEGSHLQGADLEETDFRGADLRGTGQSATALQGWGALFDKNTKFGK